MIAENLHKMKLKKQNKVKRGAKVDITLKDDEDIFSSENLKILEKQFKHLKLKPSSQNTFTFNTAKWFWPYWWA